MKIGSDFSFEDAIVAYIVKYWKLLSNQELGRTVMQKLCYFLKAKGIPINYAFEIYHYGPYCQELYFRLDELVAEKIIADQSDTPKKSNYVPGEKSNDILNTYNKSLAPYINEINEIIELLANYGPVELELLATVHYIQTSYSKFYKKVLSKDFVVSKVLEIKKEKFSQGEISGAYDSLQKNGLFGWDNT